MRSRGTHLLAAIVIAASTLLGAPVTRVAPDSTALAAGTFPDPHFRESVIETGLTNPTSIEFATDGRLYVGQKNGIVRAYDSILDTSPTTVVDLRNEVMDFWDRGLLGMVFDPAFLGARPYLYLYYVYDAPPGRTAPVWNDTCVASPTGPGANQDGCVVTSKLVRFTVNTATNVVVPNSRVELLHDWCTQYPSHSGGAMTFGDDGELYLAGGDGASFTFADYGQGGGTVPTATNPITPINPCDDPMVVTPNLPNAPTVDIATAEGGSLRSQDLRTPGDATTLAGSVIRIDPDTGLASAGNPLSGSSDLNARRIIAYGFRNPFRLTKQPGTGDIYLGDVGNVRWEEINRIVEPTGGSSVGNYGWPCYEGGIDNNLIPQSYKGLPWDGMGNNLCDDLYDEGLGAVTKPVYGYFHAGTNHPCGISGGSNASISGLAFYQKSQADEVAYPDRYNNALFFVDYSRDCLAMLRPNGNGVPDSTTWEVVGTGLGGPVDLTTGPHGDLYYADFDAGRVVRIRYAPSPVAHGTVTPAVHKAPVTVTLDASASLDPDPQASIVAWDWDLDHDGVFGEATDKSGQVVQWTVNTEAVFPITLRVTSSNGFSDTEELSLNTSNSPPVPSINSPQASLQWSVGDQVQFSGSATDAEDGALPASGLAWQVILWHCVESTCHEHLLNSFDGVASGSFSAPDHPYPSHLELRLTATDSYGTAATTSVELQPATTTLGVASVPSGVPVTVGDTASATPKQVTMIRGGVTTISAPAVFTAGSTRYRFGAWSDGLGRAHDVTVTNPATRSVTYVPDAPDTCATAKAVTPGAWTSERASGSGDQDWFRFSVSGTRRAVVTLGDLPVDAVLDLYSSCSTRLATSNQPGNRFERISRSLPAGTYRVRVRVPSDARSMTPYALRVLSIGRTLGLESATARWSAGEVRVAGQVVNGTGRTIGRVAVTATFKDAQGRVVGTLVGSTFSSRLANGAVSPFVVSGRVPAWVTVSYRLGSTSAGPARSLSVQSLQVTANGNGTVTESGRVRNGGRTTATAVTVARAWYGPRGQVLDMRVGTASPSTLRSAASGSFSILRPALSGVQAAATFLRGR